MVLWNCLFHSLRSPSRMTNRAHFFCKISRECLQFFEHITYAMLTVLYERVCIQRVLICNKNILYNLKVDSYSFYLLQFHFFFGKSYPFYHKAYIHTFVVNFPRNYSCVYDKYITHMHKEAYTTPHHVIDAKTDKKVQIEIIRPEASPLWSSSKWHQNNL